MSTSLMNVIWIYTLSCLCCCLSLLILNFDISINMTWWRRMMDGPLPQLFIHLLQQYDPIHETPPPSYLDYHPWPKYNPYQMWKLQISISHSRQVDWLDWTVYPSMQNRAVLVPWMLPIHFQPWHRRHSLLWYWKYIVYGFFWAHYWQFIGCFCNGQEWSFLWC